MSYSTLPNTFNVDIETPWEFVRSLLLWVWDILTTDFLHYGTLSFSIFDVFFGFTILAIILRLIYLRMHLASAVGSVQEMKSSSDAQRAAPSYLGAKEQYIHAKYYPDFVGPIDVR